MCLIELNCRSALKYYVVCGKYATSLSIKRIFWKRDKILVLIIQNVHFIIVRTLSRLVVRAKEVISSRFS